MQNLTNKLIAVAAVGVLAAIGSMMTPHHATAQTGPSSGPSGSAPVTVVNTAANPVPVTGSTNISGTVAATQSGTWNVSITGTPTVNLSTGTAVPVNLQGDALSRVAYDLDITIPNGSSTGHAGPLGIINRIMIDFVSAACNIPAGQAIQVSAAIGFGPGGFGVPLTSLSPVAPAGSSPQTGIAQQTTVAADSIASVQVSRTDTSGTANCFVRVFGHQRI
jgi:hypothetical protein